MNMFYDPQDYGLQTVGSFDWAEPSYDFDMCAVWVDIAGEYWVGEDSGCSCPAPYEDFTSITMLDGPYNKKTLKSKLLWMVDKRVSEGYGCYSKAELVKSVRNLMERTK